MLLKIIVFIAAAMPVILLLRSLFFRRSTRFSEGMKTFRKQVDIVVWILLGFIGCAVVVALGRWALTMWPTQ